MRARLDAIVGSLFLLLGLCACGPVGGPAAFWKGYRSGLIVKQQSDQGPWGGHRWIHWESPDVGAFSELEVRQFAQNNGWRLVERIEVSSREMSGWTGFDGRNLFPLFYPKHSGVSDDFRRHISRDSVILKFDSRWMREDAGTNEMSTAYGYVQLSKDGQQMAIYHLWGNS